MTDKYYESPEVKLISVNPEGLLCSSPMQLPDVDWTEGEDW